MSTRNLTLITLWSWEVITYEIDYEIFREMKKWQSTIYLSKLQREINIKDIKDTRAKVWHYWEQSLLEAPKASESQFQKNKQIMQEYMQSEPFKKIKKNKAIKKRDILLKQLRELEIELWLDITEDLAKQFKIDKIKKQQDLLK